MLCEKIISKGSMPNPRDFFSQKKEWSKLKDQILNKYLVPYLAKITFSGRPTCIVDCFAGKGIFDDGQLGSPLFIMSNIADKLRDNPSLNLRAVFIEKNYAHDLRANLTNAANFEIIDGEYEDFISQFISKPLDPNSNFFFFVDPYGIKNLNFSHFEGLTSIGLKSLEILVNMNSTGFLREGCHILSYSRTIPSWAEDQELETDGRNSSDRMDAIAGGDYWQRILELFQNHEIDFHQAEELFMERYIARLRSIFRHIVNIPIKERSRHMPKYRLVFMTNSREGLFLMTNEMNKAWHAMLENENDGQLSFFSEEELQEIVGQTIVDKIWMELEGNIELSELLTKLIEHNGIAYTTFNYSAAIRQNENTRFNVCRNPSKTSTGRDSRSMDWKKCQITINRITGSRC